MSTSFTHRMRVEYADTDMAGIVHFSRFFLYVERAEHAWFRSIGLAVNTEIDGQRISWPRVSCGLEFRKPLKFPEAFDVVLTVGHIGGKTVRYDLELIREGDLLAEGHFTIVCCEIGPDGHLASTPIPDAIRAKLAG